MPFAVRPSPSIRSLLYTSTRRRHFENEFLRNNGLVRVTNTIETLTQELRHAVRRLRMNPGFTIVATLSLAIGISANTTIFSAMNAVLLRPLPYPGQDRLVAIFNSPASEPEFLSDISTAGRREWIPGSP